MFGGSLRAAVIALSVTEVLAGVKMLGVNIAGFDFGCDVLVHMFLGPSCSRLMLNCDKGQLSARKRHSSHALPKGS
jgi:hypothetical protein